MVMLIVNAIKVRDSFDHFRGKLRTFRHAANAPVGPAGGIAYSYRLHQRLRFISCSFVFAEHEGAGHPAPGWDFSVYSKSP